MERRKFLIGMGSLAAGGAAATGTGAFTSQTLSDRQVTAEVTADSNGMVGLEAGSLPSVSETGSGDLQLDLSGDDGEGINIDSTYTWGDHDNPSQSHAFMLVNNDERDFGKVEFEYDVTNDGWISTSYSRTQDQSYLTFTAYNIDGAYTTDMDAPQYAYGTPNPTSRNLLGPHPNEDFNSGDAWYIVVDADTTGADVGTDEDLTGKLSISVSDPV